MTQTDSPPPGPPSGGSLGGLFADPFQGTARGEAIRQTVEKERKPLNGRIPGEAGVWVFLLLDMVGFALIFGIIVSARMDEPEVFEAARTTLHVEFGAINTIVLLLGSLLVVRGIRAMRTGSASAPRLFLLTALCGAVFVVNKGIEYSLLASDGHAFGDNLFYGYYYISTIIHLIHLLIGIGCAFLAYRISRRPVLTGKDIRNVETIGAYWHLVDLVWVILFPLLYLMRV